MKLKCIHHKQFIETKASNSSGEYTLTKSSSITWPCDLSVRRPHDVNMWAAWWRGMFEYELSLKQNRQSFIHASDSCVSEQHVVQCWVLNSWMCAIASVQKVKLSSPVLLQNRCIPRFHPKAKYLKLFAFGFNVITPSYWLTSGPTFTHPPHPKKKQKNCLTASALF